MNGPSFAEFEADALPESDALEVVDADGLVLSGWKADPRRGLGPWAAGYLHGAREFLRDAASRICRHRKENRKQQVPPFELEWAVERHYHPLSPCTIEAGWFTSGHSRFARRSCPVRHRHRGIDYRTRSIDPNSRT